MWSIKQCVQKRTIYIMDTYNLYCLSCISYIKLVSNSIPHLDEEKGSMIKLLEDWLLSLMSTLVMGFGPED
jgi:hypothetical protein